jgi:hypothetical protein
MALAILELAALGDTSVRFTIDTGTNRFYKLTVGGKVQRRNGVDWVDEVAFSTPVSINDAADDLFHSSRDVAVPLAGFPKGVAYVQLLSFKTRQGKSPAFSRVLRVPVGSGIPDALDIDLSTHRSTVSPMTTPAQFAPPRRVPNRTCGEAYSRPASLEDLLGSILKVAAPVVLNLLGGGSGSSQPAAPGASTSPGSGSTADVIASLLRTILGSLSGAPGAAVSRPQSLSDRTRSGNRFTQPQNDHFARPLIFGIDDVLIASLVGPALQVLPQLMNAVNQQRLQNKQANHKVVTDILGGINQRLMMDQLLAAQQPGSPAGQPGAADLNQLMQLLQQAAAPAGAGEAAQATTAAPASLSQSLTWDARSAAALSSTAVLSFVMADPLPWNGVPKALFARDQAMELKVKLAVTEPAPRTPLPKAILKVVFKDAADQSVCCEKTFKQKNVLPNSVMALAFSQEEVSRLSANRSLAVVAELRWRHSGNGKEYRALGSTDIVMVNRCVMKEQGKGVSSERELTDMTQFRSFWNKVWEAPSLDAAPTGNGGGAGKKYLWDLDVTAKYSVLISGDQPTNGLMETKVLRAEADEESLAERTEGRMKAGIELSIAELNKCLPLWDGTALDRDKLKAFSSDLFSRNNSGELTSRLRLKGKAGQRGMIWVVPVLRLFEFTLSTVQRTDDSGQVIAVSDEKVRFPLPVSARILGLTSKQ